jgi:type I site-specific restriction-modification system R (restriction) subunit
MTTVGQKERATQNRVIRLFQERLGYRYLGNWEEEERAMPVEDGLLCDYLTKTGYSDKEIQRALVQLYKAQAIGEGRSLYDANKAAYEMLRYGIKVKPDGRRKPRTVWLINWKEPLKNDFAVMGSRECHGLAGTPLLKTDKQTSLEVFGSYIHTYKFDEAVKDGVVLDLRYEAQECGDDGAAYPRERGKESRANPDGMVSPADQGGGCRVHGQVSAELAEPPSGTEQLPGKP